MLFEALGGLTLAALSIFYLGAIAGGRRGYARGRFDAELELKPAVNALRSRIRVLMRSGPDAPWGEDRPVHVPRHERPEPRPQRDTAAGAPRLVIVPNPMPASGAYPVIAKFPGSQPSGVKGDEDTTTWRHDTGEFAAITEATYAAADETIAAIRDGAL